MSTRFIRKRHRRVIPIGQARLRESHLARGVTHHYRRHYPLYETASSIYNKQNILESLAAWDSYTGDTYDKIQNTADLLKLMASHEESTDQDIQEATNYICNEILSYIERPEKYTKIFDRIEEDRLQESKAQILDTIYQLKECDRVLENFKTLNEKFNVINYFIEDLKIRPLNESLYRFCDKIEDFNLQYPSTFCVAMESALYALDHIVADEVDKRRVSEGIVDYYLVNGGNEDLNAFAESLDICLQKDEFIPNEVNDYMLYIQNVLNKNQIVAESVEEYFDSSIDLQMIDDHNNLMKQNAYETIQEFQIFDKTKEIFTKIKAMPHPSIASIKEAIHALFVTHRLQDMKKNTINALSLIFYLAVGGGMYMMTGGLLGAMFGALLSITLAQSVNKEYMQEAIQGWHKHKADVERRLQAAKGEERKKLEYYMEEVDKNIEILETKYEQSRDKTSKELASAGKAQSKDENNDDITSPLGDNPLNDSAEWDINLNDDSVLQEFALMDKFNIMKSSPEQIWKKVKPQIDKKLSDQDASRIAVIVADLLNFILWMSLFFCFYSLQLNGWLMLAMVYITWQLSDIIQIVGMSYKKNVIKAWKKHMTKVEKRIKLADGKEKEGLTTYLKELTKSLHHLENTKPLAR